MPEQLIQGREAIYFGYEFAIQGGHAPDDVIAYYVAGLSDPDSLRGSLGFYRAFEATVAQNAQRATTRCRCRSWRSVARPATASTSAEAMRPSPTTCRAAVIAGAGHWVAEQAPDECWRR